MMKSICLLLIFNTGNHSEKIEHIRATGTNETYADNIVYSQHLTGIKAGDILNFTSYGEVTNDLGKKYKDQNFNVEFVWWTLLCHDSGNSSCFEEITEGKGYNITPAMHHGTWIDSHSAYLFTQDFESVYLNTRIRAASSRVKSKKDFLTVGEDYGALTGFILRACG